MLVPETELGAVEVEQNGISVQWEWRHRIRGFREAQTGEEDRTALMLHDHLGAPWIEVRRDFWPKTNYRVVIRDILPLAANKQEASDIHAAKALAVETLKLLIPKTFDPQWNTQ